MRKNHEGVCSPILVFPISLKNNSLKMQKNVLENCLLMIDDARQAWFLFGYISWAQKAAVL